MSNANYTEGNISPCRTPNSVLHLADRVINRGFNWHSTLESPLIFSNLQFKRCEFFLKFPHEKTPHRKFMARQMC